MLHEVADRDDAANLTTVDDRQMADSPLRDQRQRLENVRVGRNRDRRRAHYPANGPLEHLGTMVAQGVNDVALGDDSDDSPGFDDGECPDSLLAELAHRIIDGGLRGDGLDRAALIVKYRSDGHGCPPGLVASQP